MRQERLKARWISKFKVPTTDSLHSDPIAPNRLKEVVIDRPDQVWATDATAILTGQGWMYLVALLDLHTRKVVGWAMSQTLDANLTVAALVMATARRQPPPGLIVHSDRGSQFVVGFMGHTRTLFVSLKSGQTVAVLKTDNRVTLEAAQSAIQKIR